MLALEGDESSATTSSGGGRGPTLDMAEADMEELMDEGVEVAKEGRGTAGAPLFSVLLRVCTLPVCGVEGAAESEEVSNRGVLVGGLPAADGLACCFWGCLELLTGRTFRFLFLFPPLPMFARL